MWRRTLHWVVSLRSVVGEVYISGGCGIGYGSTLRGEYQPVRIGSFSTIGDYVMIHTFSSLGIGVPASVNIGKNVTVGHKCLLSSCIVDDDCVIGPGSSVMEGARLERGCVIAPCSVVPPGRLVPAGQVWGGSPVSFIKDVEESQRIENYDRANKHVEQSLAHVRQIADPINALELEDSKTIGRYPDQPIKELAAIQASKEIK